MATNGKTGTSGPVAVLYKDCGGGHFLTKQIKQVAILENELFPRF